MDNSAPLQEPQQIDLELNCRADGLQLNWFNGGNKPLAFHLDFTKLVQQQRSFPAPKQGAFNQALGKKTKRVLDATGGWGGDAMLMCLQGYQVTLFERDALMAVMLQDAFARCSSNHWMVDNQVTPPRVVFADAITELDKQRYPADCVYLDPMFPPKKKKSAAANKQMQLLHWLLEGQNDSSELASSAVNAAYQRVAVKRPNYADPLIAKPCVQFSSKLLHYDVYLSNGEPAA